MPVKHVNKVSVECPVTKDSITLEVYENKHANYQCIRVGSGSLGRDGLIDLRNTIDLYLSTGVLAQGAHCPEEIFAHRTTRRILPEGAVPIVDESDLKDPSDTSSNPPPGPQ